MYEKHIKYLQDDKYIKNFEDGEPTPILTTENGDLFSAQSKYKNAYPHQVNKKLVYVGKIYYMDGIYCENDEEYYFWQW